MSRLGLFLSVAIVVVVAAVLPAAAAAGTGSGGGDTARYILPPGNYGGLPDHRQLDRPAPALRRPHAAARQRHRRRHRPATSCPRTSRRSARPTRSTTGRPGLRLIYDAYGVPHVYGKTRADVAFGAGWATARDRGLLLQLGRGPARVAVADVPGIDAFSLVTSGQSFVPERRRPRRSSPSSGTCSSTPTATRAGRSSPTPRPRPTASTPTWQANGIDQPPATVNDVIAVTAFIGSIFGAGGGGEAANADLLAKLQQQLGPATGPRGVGRRDALRRPRGADHASSSRFDYGPLTGGQVTGSVDHRRGLDRVARPAPAADRATAAARRRRRRRAAGQAGVELPGRRAAALGDRQHARGDGPAARLLLPGDRRADRPARPRASRRRASACPGLAMYILIGRTQDYAWSLTSADHDVRDVFAEQLCEPDGSPPTRASDHYLFKGECRPFETFDAGTLNGTPIRYPISVHGPVIGTATVDGKPVRAHPPALDVRPRRPQPRRAQGHDRGQGDDAEALLRRRQRVRLHVQLGLRLAQRRPRTSPRACCRSGRRGLDRRLPTLGTGDYEWQGFLSERRAPARRRRARAACC